MGQNAHGHLVFGVPLGGSDEGWLLREPKDELGYASLEPTDLPWLTEDQIDEWDDLSYTEVMELGLKHLDSVTFDVTGKPLSAGLEVHSHGYDLNSFALVLKEPQFDAEWGDTSAVDLEVVGRIACNEQLVLQFERAFETLNLRPTHPTPTWFLTADYF